MVIERIHVRRLLSRYLDLYDPDRLHLLMWLSTRTQACTADEVAAALEFSEPLAVALLEDLHDQGHLCTHHKWKVTGKQLLARLTARQRAMIAEIDHASEHGERFAAIDLDPRRVNTATSLLGLGYVQRRTLYTLAPAIDEKLHGLTDP
ncbi:hypothetical protein ACTD5D_23370 [Nocardia takedensis]|uniref:hypothetical protein n=1 Tax=Nocardia takedensis TaxID=259390 RepID=UPI003F7590D2